MSRDEQRLCEELRRCYSMYCTVGDLALSFEMKTNEIPLATRLFPRQHVTSPALFPTHQIVTYFVVIKRIRMLVNKPHLDPGIYDSK